MKFKLEFDCDNVAFEEHRLLSECERIMRHVAYALGNGARKGAIRDGNGNTLGEWSLAP